MGTGCSTDLDCAGKQAAPKGPALQAPVPGEAEPRPGTSTRAHAERADALARRLTGMKDRQEDWPTVRPDHGVLKRKEGGQVAVLVLPFPSYLQHLWQTW